MDVASAHITQARRSLRIIGLCLTLAVGAVLRLAWVGDMEYKRDERLIFQRTQQACRTGTWPWLGEESSVGLRTPGMSLWGFVLIGHILGADEPTRLARGVQIADVAALLLLLGFVFWKIPLDEREAWLWAIALLAVNPLAVLYQRKMWNPSLFPLPVLLFLVGWWHRERRGGALLWGLVGACLGQIQMAGFFFAAGFAGWALLLDRTKTRWRWWFSGSILGALPLLPWLHDLWTQLGNGPAHAVKWTRWLTGQYFSRWLANPLGLTLEFSLGSDFGDFLSYPLLGGRRTYLVTVLHGAVVLLGVIILLRALLRWREARPALVQLTGQGSPTAFTVAAALWGYGVLLTASSLPVHRHYLIVLFPLGFVWLARLTLGTSTNGRRLGRGVLLSLSLTQALITAAFLGYVHTNQRHIRGDYGIPYEAQVGTRGLARH